MGLVIREVAGWALIVIGLILIGIVVRLAVDRSVIEAVAVSFPASIVFRSGIGLVRLATAGRMAEKMARQSLADHFDSSRNRARTAQ